MPVEITLYLIGTSLLALPGHGAFSSELAPDNSRWKQYPSHVVNVKVDHSGRPWFALRDTRFVVADKRVKLDDVKRRVEEAVDEPTPYVVDAFILLHDTKGRAWIQPARDSQFLLAYDPTRKTWLERGLNETALLSVAWESKRGSIYFAARQGLHVLQNSSWSYKDLYSVNFKEKLLFSNRVHAFAPPESVDGYDGQTYVWTRWGIHGKSGTVGYWVHDGKTWWQVRTLEGRKLERLESVTPLANGSVLICPKGETAFIARPKDVRERLNREIADDVTKLADAQFTTRQAAERRLLTRGAAIAPQLRDALQVADDVEVQSRLKWIADQINRLTVAPGDGGFVFNDARCRAIDHEGNAYVWVDDATTPDGKSVKRHLWRISKHGHVLPSPFNVGGWYPDRVFVDKQDRLYCARLGEGCVILNGDRLTRITDDTQIAYRNILGEDADGRIYLSKGNLYPWDDQQVIAYNERGEDDRPTLSSTMYKVRRIDNSVMQDSLGRVWATLSDPRVGLPSVFEETQWTHIKPDEEQNRSIEMVQQLRDGFLVARDTQTGFAHLYNGESWAKFDSLEALVQEDYGVLKDRIDNRHSCRPAFEKLCSDADRRVWLVERSECKVYDGTRWFDVGAALETNLGKGRQIDHCLAVDGGKAMIISNSRATVQVRIEDRQISHDRLVLPEPRAVLSTSLNQNGIWYNANDDLFIPPSGRGKRCFLYDGKHFRPLPTKGYPRLVDTMGDSWFLQPYEKKLVVMSEDGAMTQLEEDSLDRSTVVVEQVPGMYWISTTRGLLQLKKRKQNGKVELINVQHYTRAVPNGTCLRMFSDKTGHLWYLGYGSDDLQLWRIVLPRPDEHRG